MCDRLQARQCDISFGALSRGAGPSLSRAFRGCFAYL
jgi:hypothetical protein